MKTPFALFALLLFGFCLPAAVAAPAKESEQEKQVVALAKEVQEQQKAIAGNQKKITEKMAAIAEALRYAKIYSSRSGK